MRRNLHAIAASAPINGTTSPAAAHILNYGIQSNQTTNPYLHFSPPPNGAGSYPDLEVLYSPNNTMPPRRETGIIEKLLQNFGFVQCCDRQARLFFHFSQYSGNIDDLKNGDEVEFEAGLDRRTGKPIALNIQKHARIPSEIISDKRYVGDVTYAPKHNTIIKPVSGDLIEYGQEFAIIPISSCTNYKKTLFRLLPTPAQKQKTRKVFPNTPRSNKKL